MALVNSPLPCGSMKRKDVEWRCSQATQIHQSLHMESHYRVNGKIKLSKIRAWLLMCRADSCEVVHGQEQRFTATYKIVQQHEPENI